MGRRAPADLVTVDAAELIAVAEEAARAAGSLLRERFLAGGERAVGAKSTPTDLVSEADLAAERAVRDVLAARRPGDAVLGEEGGESAGRGELRWIVDPLDGTVNFLFGVPQWCVSVAAHDADGGVAGVVFDPLRGELFAASREGPATLTGPSVGGSASVEAGVPPGSTPEMVPLPAPRDASLPEALVATGFSYDARVRGAQAVVAARLLPRVRDLRRMGSAALDLAWTAAGRCDAYYERGVKPWDVAAGTLICERAGLEVRDLPERDGLPFGIVAASRELMAELAPLLA